MKRFIVFAMCILLACLLAACAPAAEVVTVEPATAPTPEPTATPAPRPVIPQAIFDSLCAPLGYIAQTADGGAPYEAGDGQPDDAFIDAFLYAYANGERLGDAKAYDVHNFLSGHDSVKLTEDELNQYMRSVFGERFSAEDYTPNDYTVTRQDGAYYIMISESGYVEVTYAGEAPTEFDENLVYVFTAVYHDPGVQLIANMRVKLAEYPPGTYGYSIEGVRIGEKRNKAQEDSIAGSTLNGKWMAVAVTGTEERWYGEDEVWYLQIVGHTAYEYDNYENYINGEHDRAYRLEKQADGSARMMIGETVAPGMDGSGEAYATLRLYNEDMLLCENGGVTVTMIRDGGFEYGQPNEEPFDRNGFIFPESSEAFLNTGEVLGDTQWEGYDQLELLGFARNEIYARHGHAFRTAKYADFYMQYAWYAGLEHHEVDESEFNDFEHANIQVIGVCEELVKNG